jgi:hypothetical protein
MKINRLIFYIAVIALIFSVTACDDPPDPTPISAAAFDITVPAANRLPATAASSSGNFTVASVSWIPNDHTFMVYEAYTVFISLTANGGYFFTDDFSAVINDQTASVSGGGSTVTLSYAFDEIFDSENEGMNGSPEKPFKVYDVATLKRVGTESGNGWTLFADYEQIDDIILPPVNAEKSNWIAIGSFSNSAGNSFRGIYDGGGHTISNLTINANSGYQGMFGYLTTTGTVKNVGIIKSSIKGNICGGVVGRNDIGTIQNCYFSGSVTGGGDVGGIVGQNNGTVQNCYSTGSVSGGYTGIVGGVVGSNSVSVQNCAALNDSVITSHNSSAVGRVVGEHNNGALANNYARGGMILKCNWYGSTGDDKTPVNNPAGEDGESISEGQYKSEAWWKDTGNWKTDGGASAWDFVNIWEWDSAAGLPVLKK